MDTAAVVANTNVAHAASSVPQPQLQLQQQQQQQQQVNAAAAAENIKELRALNGRGPPFMNGMR